MMDDLNLDERRNALLGPLDELNSLIGVAKCLLQNKEDIELLTMIQYDLFTIQSHVAYPETYDAVSGKRALALQLETQKIESRLPPLTHFIVPEGVLAACMLHCVRTAARAVERHESGYLDRPTNLAMYMDRLACLMFALARKINLERGIVERAFSILSGSA